MPMFCPCRCFINRLHQQDLGKKCSFLIYLPSIPPFDHPPPPWGYSCLSEKCGGCWRTFSLLPWEPLLKCDMKFLCQPLKMCIACDTAPTLMCELGKNRPRLLSVSPSAVKQNRHASAAFTHMRGDGGATENPPTHSCHRVPAQFTIQFRVLS